MHTRAYALVMLAYGSFTLTDGALRMVVLLYFYDLGFSALSLAMLFLLYELFGVVTNLVGGWFGTRAGLRRTLVLGMGLQVVALLLLSLHDPSWRTWVAVLWVMVSQALSGVAKDLTKVSSKTAVKFLADEGALFRWVARLTGSKNALKGIGFFVGAFLLNRIGFQQTLLVMAALLTVALAVTTVSLRELGQGPTKKPPLAAVLQKSPAVTRLSIARGFLFAARDVWFVIALPIFLESQFGWSFEAIGALLAVWVIGYGAVQAIAPRFNRDATSPSGAHRRIPSTALFVLFIFCSVLVKELAAISTVVGVLGFGVLFAITSSVHSYLILAYAKSEDAAMDVGFYYAANAAGRLVGTLLSGVLFTLFGFEATLVCSMVFLLIAGLVSLKLPPVPQLAATGETAAPAAG